MNDAQLSMGFVLGLVVSFFIIMAFISIHYGISMSGTQAEKLKKLETDAVQIATVVSALPELQCTRNNEVTLNCINEIDAIKLGELMKKPTFSDKYRLFYQSLLGFSKITIYENFVNECNDGVDNDDDGDIDNLDGDCAGASRISESSATTEPDPIVIYDNEGDKNIYKRHYTITVKKLIYDPLGIGDCFALGKGSCNYGRIEIEVFSK